MKLGIALSGGGVLGSAHLGILAALEEQGIVPDLYAGSSAGAIVASFKALGYSNDECLAIIEKIDNKLVDIDWTIPIKVLFRDLQSIDGLAKGKKLQKFIQQESKNARLSDTIKPLAIISCDISRGKQIIFCNEPIENKFNIDDEIEVIEEDLSIAQIVYASAAVPGIYRPMRYKDMVLVDGSVINNLPVNVLTEMGATHLIAIELNNRHLKVDIKGIADVLGRSLNVLIEQNTDLATKSSDGCIYLHPSIPGVGLLDFHQLKEAYTIGYQYGKTIAEMVESELKRLE